jgi:hypothetical protein
MKQDKMMILLGVSLVVASCCSYFVIDAFGQQSFDLNCPKNAYHGLDNQGNEICRDVLTNEILESEPMITNLDSEKILNSDSQTIVDYEQFPIVEILIFSLIGIIGGIIGVIAKKRKLSIFQKLGWNNIQKEQVRDRQYGNCNMCFTQPSQWKYDYFDGNKNNNDLDNCQGLCPDCFSVKSDKGDQVSIYQESNSA